MFVKAVGELQEDGGDDFRDDREVLSRNSGGANLINNYRLDGKVGGGRASP